jgi:hypothetical protein
MNGTISSHVIIMQSEYRNGVSELRRQHLRNDDRRDMNRASIGDKQTYERE